MDLRQISRLRRRFESMEREERHFVHRHLLDVMRQQGDPQLSDNTDHIGSRITADEKQQLQLLAAVGQTSVSALIRTAVRRYIQQTSLPQRSDHDPNTTTH